MSDGTKTTKEAKFCKRLESVPLPLAWFGGCAYGDGKFLLGISLVFMAFGLWLVIRSYENDRI